CGKSTIARLYATSVPRYEVITLENGASVRDIREAIKHEPGVVNHKCMMVDEIQRCTKVQQEELLPHVETGRLTLIGTTTEPATRLVPALLSRCQCVSMEGHSPEAILRVVARGVSLLDIDMTPQTAVQVVRAAGGDARRALNLLDEAVRRAKQREAESDKGLSDRRRAGHKVPRLSLTPSDLASSGVSPNAGAAEQALRRSIALSHPQAACFYCALLLALSEDIPRVGRVLMGECVSSVGLSDPTAVCVVSSCIDVAERVGVKEGGIPLTQAALYLAQAPKSSAVKRAYEAAIDIVSTPPPSLSLSPS
ncbi:hypothetical protein KIPB_010478, partial [Kipferlia bialata]